MENIDIVNEFNEPIGKSESRDLVHKLGLYHREIIALIVNSKNELLLSKRSCNKKQAPNKWEFCSGHVISGDEVENTVIKEINEELGIKIDISECEVIDIRKIDKKFYENQYNNFFQYTFLIKKDILLKDCIIQKEEVSQIKYISISELEDILINKDENYIFTSDNLIKYMYEILRILKGEKNENRFRY